MTQRPPHTRDAALPNGYYTVPPGKLANAVTWLEMRGSPPRPLPEPLPLSRVAAAEGETLRGLYGAIGAPWLWSRTFDSTAADPNDTYLANDDDGHPVGIVELADHGADGLEIVYFGLRPEATGRSLGRRMMAAALDLAWPRANRVWLHTCNFDHPFALRFYLGCGFTPYAVGFEIMDDPRIGGPFSRDAAPHVPFIPLVAD